MDLRNTPDSVCDVPDVEVWEITPELTSYYFKGVGARSSVNVHTVPLAEAPGELSFLLRFCGYVFAIVKW